MAFIDRISIIIILRVLVHLGILLACLRLVLLLLEITLNIIIFILLPIDQLRKPSPNPLFAEKVPLSDSRLNAKTAHYFSQCSTTNTHVQAEPVQVVEAAVKEFTSYVNVKIGSLTTKVLFDSSCSKSLISIDLVRRIHVKLQPLELSDTTFMIGNSGSTKQCLGKIGVNVLLNDFPVYTEFLVLNNFTQ